MWEIGSAVRTRSSTMLPSLSVTSTASVVSQSMQPSETLSRMFDELKSKYVGVKEFVTKYD